jgi:hypothetical protein
MAFILSPKRFTSHHQHRPAGDVSHLIAVPPLLMAHFKAKLKDDDDKASPCFRTF